MRDSPHRVSNVLIDPIAALMRVVIAAEKTILGNHPFSTPCGFVFLQDVFNDVSPVDDIIVLK